MRENYLGRPKYRLCENKEYEKFVKKKACIVCQQVPAQGHHVDHARRNATLLVPLCAAHHLAGHPDAYHQIEREKFEERHNLNLDWVCLNLLSEFLNKE